MNPVVRRRIAHSSSANLTGFPPSGLPARRRPADGKYLCALNAEEAKLAVVDTATGRQVKALENVGTYPYMVRALP